MNASLRRISALSAGALLSGVLSVVTQALPAQAATTWTVCATGCNYSTIQGAVTSAVSGDTVNVATGTYTEQLVIDKNLTLVGSAGAATTIIQAPLSLTPDPDGAKTVVLFTGSITAEFSGFTVQGPVNGLNFGIYVRAGATANIHNNVIKDIRESSLSDGQIGVAIEVGKYNDTAPFVFTTGTATITNNTISGYQKMGISIERIGSSATITGNTVTGAGPITTTAQNGIYIRRGATGTIKTNTVTENAYNGPSSSAIGIGVLHGGSGVIVQGNTTNHNSANIYVWKSDGIQIKDNQVSDSSPVDQNAAAGITVQSDGSPSTTGGSPGNYLINATISGNTIQNNLSGGSSQGDGIDLYAVDGATVSENAIIGTAHDGILVGASKNSTFTSNTLTNNGLVFADPHAAGIDFGGQAGSGVCSVAPCPSGDLNPVGGFTAHSNTFVGNRNAIWNYDSGSVDATNNWWGTIVPLTIASEISGNVTYNPWSNSGAFTAKTYYVGTGQTYTSIQSAINSATSGDTINVATGTYIELVNINKELTLTGSGTTGINATTIQAPGSMTMYDNGAYYSGAIRGENKPIVRIAASNVTVQNFHITPNDQAIGSYGNFNGVGVLVDHVGGTTPTAFTGVQIKNNLVDGVTTTDASFDAVRILAQATVTVSGNAFYVYGGGNGVRINGAELILPAGSIHPTVNVTSNTIYAGPANRSTPNHLFYGIYYITGATGTAYGNTIYGAYGWALNAWNAGDVTFDHNIINTDGDIARSDPGHGAQLMGTSLATPSHLTFTNNAILNKGYAAISSLGASYPLASLTATGNAISNTKDGFIFDHVTSGTFNVTDNSIQVTSGRGIVVGGTGASGTDYGNWTGASTVTINAINNWWGSVAGPGAPTNVTTVPWCTDAACSTLSNNANLVSLSLSTGTLSPTFTQSTTAYSASVGNGITTVTVSESATPGANAVVTGGSSLNVGDNTVTIGVTSADGTATKTYTITVSRGLPVFTPPPQPSPEDIAKADAAAKAKADADAKAKADADAKAKADADAKAKADAESKTVVLPLSSTTTIDVSTRVSTVTNTGSIVTQRGTLDVAKFTLPAVIIPSGTTPSGTTPSGTTPSGTKTTTAETTVDLTQPQDMGGGISVTVEKAVIVASSSAGEPITLTNATVPNVSVNIPDGTTVLAPASWDGKINPPSAGTSTGTPPSGFSVGSQVVEVGSSTAVLLFDHPASVVLTGVTGSVGYRPSGSTTWVPISPCGPAGPVFPGACSQTDGINTTILTFHFTSFAALTVLPAAPLAAPPAPKTPVVKTPVAKTVKMTVVVSGSGAFRSIKITLGASYADKRATVETRRYGQKTFKKLAVVMLNKAGAVTTKQYLYARSTIRIVVNGKVLVTTVFLR
jgi:parallel beta-helix repeat protein